MVPFHSFDLEGSTVQNLRTLPIKGSGVCRSKETDLDRDTPLPGGCWANYPLGVVRAFTEAGFVPDRGLDLVFGGDIPFGSGLSSSAALEVLTGVMLRGLFSFGDGGISEELILGMLKKLNEQ